MAVEQTSVELVETMTLHELCVFCGPEETWVVELVSHGILDPDGFARENWRFRGINITRAKKARRLQRDLGINTPGIAMVLDLLDERDRLLRRAGMASEE